ncbi:MAG: hypothetical protein D9V44_01460 [Actinobacteria bacterium]|nr:MAG: hypothetical protein D9V44_01460 [Actinomycetota bacterium]
MDLRSKKIIAMLVGGALVVGLAGGLLGFLLRGPALNEALNRADQAEKKLAAVEDSSSAEVSSSVEPTTPPTDSGTPTVSTAEDGKHFCYIKTIVDKNGGTYLTVDYAEMLTGKAAADAAAAAGQESPPPNDYFISNTNKKLREFPVDTAINVTLTSTAEGVQPEGYKVPFGDFQNIFTGVASGPDLTRQPFWITIKNGTITVIAEQYLP